MTQLVDEIQALFGLYPDWLVWTCLAVVALGVVWLVWRIVKFSMAVIVTALLVGLVGFAAYVIFTS